jgi:hypothetical protein
MSDLIVLETVDSANAARRFEAARFIDKADDLRPGRSPQKSVAWLSPCFKGAAQKGDTSASLSPRPSTASSSDSPSGAACQPRRDLVQGPSQRSTRKLWISVWTVIRRQWR